MFEYFELYEIVIGSISSVIGVILLITGFRDLIVKEEFTLTKYLVGILILVIPSITIWFLMYYYNGPNYLYWIILFLYILSQFLMSLVSYTSLHQKNEVIKNIAGYSMLIPFLISIIALPILIFSQHTSKNNVISSDLNISEIENNFENIKNSFSELESKIQSETTEIQIFSEKLMNNITEKQKELKAIEISQIELKKEVEYYKKLSNISKEEAELILNVLKKENRGVKYIEYFLGFFIGIIGSVIANFIYKKMNAILSTVTSNVQNDNVG